MTDPFLIRSNSNQQNFQNQQSKLVSSNENDLLANKSLQFEDNFICKQTPKQLPNSKYQPLSDSQAYLEGLERKLDKLRKNSKLVQAIAEKRQDCLRSFLENDNWICQGDKLLELEENVKTSTGSSICQSVYRQLQPVQAVTIGETVQLVQHDQLNQHSDSEDDISKEQKRKSVNH